MLSMVSFVCFKNPPYAIIGELCLLQRQQSRDIKGVKEHIGDDHVCLVGLPAGASFRNTIAVAAGGTCGVVATVGDQANTVLNSIRVLPNGAMLSSDKANARVVQVLT